MLLQKYCLNSRELTGGLTSISMTEHALLLLTLALIVKGGGTKRKKIKSHNLAHEIRAKRKSVEVIENRGDILKRLHEYQTYVIFGARDETLSDFAKEIAGAIFSASEYNT